MSSRLTLINKISFMKEYIKPEISISPLVEFIFASDRKKTSIIKAQKNPSSFIVGRYRSARSAFSKYFKNDFDKEVLIETIERLQNKTEGTSWAKNDRSNSILALVHFFKLNFPFQDLKCTFVKPDHKTYELEGINVIVSPDLIIQWKTDGVTYVGAIKFYIKKQNLTYQKGGLTATLIYDYLKKVSLPEWQIDMNYCFCLDVMNERLFSPTMIEENIIAVKDACLEIKRLWGQVN